MFSFRNFIYLIILISVLIIGYFYNVFYTIPGNFPRGEVFLIEEGESLKSVSVRLENDHIINSALWFRAFLSLKRKDRNMQLGYYKFDTPISLSNVAQKIFQTGPDLPLIKVTFPEGSNTDEISKILKGALPNFSEDKFKLFVKQNSLNGFLFPSTYFLLPSSNEESIALKMKKVFDKQFVWIDVNGKHFLNNEKDFVILASILEGEAKTGDDMKIVSGILQKRLASNMALQVDVAKETYKTKGLPITPLNNPGSIAIDAAYNPTETNYFFYLTGRDGKMHYAKTFAEHKSNIAKYLK